LSDIGRRLALDVIGHVEFIAEKLVRRTPAGAGGAQDTIVPSLRPAPATRRN
jgi:hypothetical protein